MTENQITYIIAAVAWTVVISVSTVAIYCGVEEIAFVFAVFGGTLAAAITIIPTVDEMT